MAIGTAIVSNGYMDVKAMEGSNKLKQIRDMIVNAGGLSVTCVFNESARPSKYSNEYLHQVVDFLKVSSLKRTKLSILALQVNDVFGPDVLDQMINNKWTYIV